MNEGVIVFRVAGYVDAGNREKVVYHVYVGMSASLTRCNVSASKNKATKSLQRRYSTHTRQARGQHKIVRYA